MSRNRDKRRRQAEVARRKNVGARAGQGVQPGSATAALQILQESWTGPIPRPQDLAGYEAVQAGFAERIVAMAEQQLDLVSNQQAHRIDVEDLHVRGLHRRADVGLWMAFVLALVVLAGGMILVAEGHDAAGTAIVTIDLVGLVGVFVYGRHDQRRQERQP